MKDNKTENSVASHGYVFLLWDYDEHGPTNLRATLERNRLTEILKELDVDGWFSRVGDDPAQRLVEALEKTDEELAGADQGQWKLMDGWGGLVLQVVKLDT